VLRWVALRLQDRRGATGLRPPSLAGWWQGGVFSAGGLPLYSCCAPMARGFVCSLWVPPLFASFFPRGLACFSGLHCPFVLGGLLPGVRGVVFQPVFPVRTFLELGSVLSLGCLGGRRRYGDSGRVCLGHVGVGVAMVTPSGLLSLMCASCSILCGRHEWATGS